MENPLVSIIVPCYNYAHYLGETLQNIFSQQYQQWECLIIDDGSTDNTASVAAGFVNKDARFRYFYQSNQGLSAARNHGIRQSSGQFIQFLDSDDLIHAKKILLQVALLQQKAEADLVYGNSVFFFNDDLNQQYTNRERKETAKGTSHFPLRITGQGKVITRQLMVDNIMEVSNALVRKTLIDKTGFFDETMKSYEDWQYWIRCSFNNAFFYYDPQPGTETYIRFGHASMMTNRKKLTLHGIRIRKLLHPYLNFRQRLYNYYRLSKLYTRLLLNIF